MHGSMQLVVECCNAQDGELCFGALLGPTLQGVFHVWPYPNHSQGALVSGSGSTYDGMRPRNLRAMSQPVTTAQTG